MRGREIDEPLLGERRRAEQQLGHHRIAEPVPHGREVRVRARHVMARKRAVRQAELVPQKRRLQRVAPAVRDDGRLARALAGEALREPARGEFLRGDQPVAHRAERRREAAAHRLALRRHAADRHAAFEQRECVILILDDQLEQHPLAREHRSERGQEPRAEAVRVERDRDRDRRAALGFELRLQIDLQQRHPAQVLQHALAVGRRPARPRAQQQRRAEARLQRPHALRDGRRGHVQPRGRLLEAAGIGDGDERRRLFRIDRHLSLAWRRAHRPPK
ncbi:hypothetical protein DM47_5137 [Burkholderia mallei]|nr:hypothetical protein DM47_5137 [Burkholderia mallei]KOT25734.1 hypothetical protein DM52_4890 [Burkholderia mallei]